MAAPVPRARVRIQTVALAFVAASRWRADYRRGRKVHNLVQEIASSEETYLTGLETLLNVYLNPITSALTSPRKTALHTLFQDTTSGLEAIITVNRTFLNEMRERVAQARTLHARVDALGETMRRFGSAWKLYRSYHCLYDQVLRELGSIESPTIKSLIASSSERPSITNLLILPVQRLPRYEMFLEQLVRTVCHANPHVDEALRVVHETVHWLDDRIVAAMPTAPRATLPTSSSGGTLKKNEAKRGSSPSIKPLPAPNFSSLATALTLSVHSPPKRPSSTGKGGSRIQTAADRAQRIAAIDASMHSTSPHGSLVDPTAPRRRSRSMDLSDESTPTSPSLALSVRLAPSPLSREHDKVAEENQQLKAQLLAAQEQLARANERIEKLEAYRRKYKARKKEDKARRKAAVVSVSAGTGVVTRGLSSTNLQRRRPSATLA